MVALSLLAIVELRLQVAVYFPDELTMTYIFDWILRTLTGASYIKIYNNKYHQLVDITPFSKYEPGGTMVCSNKT